MLQSLKQLRKKLKLTQGDFAQMLGISRTYLTLIETGKRKIPESIAKQLETLFQENCVYLSPEYNSIVAETSSEYNAKDTEQKLFETEQVIKMLQQKLDEKEALIKNLTQAVANLSTIASGVGNSPEQQPFTPDRLLSREKNTLKNLTNKEA